MAQTSIIPRNILVVDDEAYVCDALKMLLTIDGHEVATASSGAEALGLFDQKTFDVVITDYSMPTMKGDELAAAIKARKPGQPIVMITAYVEVLTGSKTPLNGIDVLVSKPFRLEQLRDAIVKALA
jgi:CheY-like chemotaxis protein